MNMQLHDDDLYLLVESGPHQGARVALGCGDYDIGQDPGCDLVLRDSGLSARHLRLQVSTVGEVVVEALDERVRVNGRPIGASRLSLHPDDILSAGNSTLRICCPSGRIGARAVGRWPQRAEKLGDALGVGMLGTVSRLGGLHPALQRSLTTPRQWLESGAGGRVVGSFVGHALAMSQGVSGWLQGRWHIVSVLAVAIMFVALSLPVSSSLQSPKSPVAWEADKVALQTMLAERGFGDVGVDAAANGLLVTGMVTDDEALQALKGLVDSQGAVASVDVQLASALAARVQDVLQKMNMPHVTVGLDAGGGFVAAGYVVDREQWLAARDTVVRDFRGVNRIDDSGVFDSKERMASLQSKLAAAGLSSDLSVEANAEGTLLVNGVVSYPVLDEWAAVLTSYRQEFGDLPRVESAVRSLNNVLNIDVRSASTGQVPYIVMREGGRYLVGTTLPGGYVLTSIHPEYLTVKRDGRELMYLLGLEAR